MFDGEKGKLKLSVLNELRLDAYENSKLYKEITKNWHDKHITRREFKESDYVLLFNSRFKLFPSKLRSRWSWPFQIHKMFSFGAVDILSEATRVFIVSSQRLKHYVIGNPVEKMVNLILRFPT
ncbi:uncharacterized protein [Cicer arietinum]|uniref:Uncharacterized protein LOC101511965 n=1 Tax=Cicer arietinum TaxID=3827 RepID=A0A1S2Z5F7_CICAR|nr:uncharacterized protein LOC101511965 [Cicer arietinum]